jgi:hypothetical protein
VECFGYFLRSSAAARNSTNHGLINSDSPSHTFVNTVEHRDGDEQVLSIVIWALISVAHLASAGAEFTHPPELFRTVQPPLGRVLTFMLMVSGRTFQGRSTPRPEGRC